ncbi:MAG: PhnB protein [Bacillota bacterium]|nr:MAG: PhnB protein [Bacillota bacterium]
MPINAYVAFNDNCHQAVEFYAEVFQTSEPKIVTYGEGSPDDSEFSLPEEFKSMVMHTELAAPSCSLMHTMASPWWLATT